MKRSIGILFPGQGVQYVGLLNQYICLNSLKASKVVFYDKDIASIVSDYDKVLTEKTNRRISDLLIAFDTDNDGILKDKSSLLKSTLYTQYAVQLFNHIRFHLFFKENISNFCTFHVFGRSLGELSAFLLSSSLTNTECAEITYVRGLITEEANRGINGKMINLIGDSEVSLNLYYQYKAIKTNGSLSLAGIHSKRLIVICGLKEEVADFHSFINLKSKEIEKKIIVKDLNVQGIFHSNLLNKAEEQFYNFLNSKEFDFTIKSQFIRHTTVKKLRHLNINSYSKLHNQDIYKVLSTALVEPYDTDTIFSSLQKEEVSTLDLAMNKELNYKDYI